MIKRELTPQILDQYLGIASWVDSKIAPPKKPKASQMFNLIQVIPDETDHNKYGKSNIKVIPTSKQLQIYELVLNIMIKSLPEYRDLIYLRHFPRKKSFRDLKYFFVGDSHETIRTKYNNALYDISRMVNKIGLQKFI
tara:strand:- start:1201 stop:1614 length:414 start_codon:yes stop_codon:yes gene_type:complete